MLKGRLRRGSCRSPSESITNWPGCHEGRSTPAESVIRNQDAPTFSFDETRRWKSAGIGQNLAHVSLGVGPRDIVGAP